MSATVSVVRRDRLAESWAAVERRLRDACANAGRSRDEVTLIAVTKRFPAEDVAALAALGVTDVGENRDQEARAKRAELAGFPGGPGDGLRWHHVGALQRNKCRAVAGYAFAVHSVDRVPLAGTLAIEAARAGRRLEIFVQVSLDDDPGRAGAGRSDVAEIARVVADAESLRLAGVMAVAPRDADPDVAFAQLAEVSRSLRVDHPAASAISAGMSADLEAAVAHGATHVRIGTALLGGRPPPLG